MIKKITKSNLEAAIRKDVRSAKIADYLRENVRDNYNRIIDYYVLEGNKLIACLVSCGNYGSDACEICNNKSVDRLYVREDDECVDIEPTKDNILELTALHAVWSIEVEAKRIWLIHLSDAAFARLVANADLFHDLQMAATLYGHDFAPEQINTERLIADWADGKQSIFTILREHRELDKKTLCEWRAPSWPA